MKALLHLLLFVAAALLALGISKGGGWIAAPFIFVFVALPLLDAAAGVDAETRPEAGPRWLWDAPLWAWIPVQLGLTLAALARIAGGGLGPLEAAGLAAGVGLLGGSGGINAAHELMHRAGRVPRAAAELLMAWVGYPHFCVEHVHGHHRHVATPRDPATARLGESLPAFLWRCVSESLASAWRIEARRGHRGLGDARVRQPLLLVALWGGVAAGFGWVGLVAFLSQGVVAVFLLESINYVEHYGLRRRELAPGRFERVRPEHSWNSGHRVSNGYLFNLARHSDHHAVASRPYEVLRHSEDAPQLPAGYATMLLLAWVPPLWFRVMDRRARAWSARRAEPLGEVAARTVRT